MNLEKVFVFGEGIVFVVLDFVVDVVVEREYWVLKVFFEYEIGFVEVDIKNEFDNIIC